MNFSKVSLATILGTLLLAQQGQARLNGHRDLVVENESDVAGAATEEEDNQHHHHHNDTSIDEEDHHDNHNGQTYPPQAVTLWWAFSNNPENCVTNPTGEGVPCGPVDVFGEPFVVSLKSGLPDNTLIIPNMAANISIIYATGGVTDEYGNIRLVASKYLNRGSTPLDIDMSINPLGQKSGFSNLNAQVSLVVKTHGDYHGDPIQLTDLFDPYCDDHVLGWKGSKNPTIPRQQCLEIQDTAFAPGFSGTKPLNVLYSNPPLPLEGTSATLIRRGDALQAVVETNVFARPTIPAE